MALNGGLRCALLGSRRSAGADQLVNDRIHERLERGINDVGRYADGGPTVAVLVLALDENARDGLRAAIEYPHAVIAELESADIALILAEVLAQREVKRVDRADPFRGGNQALPVDPYFNDRQGDRDALAHSIAALLNIDV